MLATTTAQDQKPAIIFDRRSFMARCMGNQNLANKLIATLLDTLPREQRSLQCAVASNDMPEVRRIAHRVLGTARNICAAPLSHAAYVVEQAAEVNDTTAVEQNYETLMGHLEALSGELVSGAELT